MPSGNVLAECSTPSGNRTRCDTFPGVALYFDNRVFNCGNADSQLFLFCPSGLINKSFCSFLSQLFSSILHETSIFPAHLVECQWLLWTTQAFFSCCSPPLTYTLMPWLNNLTQLGVTECGHRYGGNVSCWMNPPRVLQLPVSCLWEKIGQCCGRLWRENRKTQWKPGEKGTLTIVEHNTNNFSLMGTNTSLWFHYFKHCEDEYTCWWMSMTYDLSAASLWCLGISLSSWFYVKNSSILTALWYRRSETASLTHILTYIWIYCIYIHIHIHVVWHCNWIITASLHMFVCF